MLLFVCWASVADSDTTLQRHKSMCVLGTLNTFPFDKQIYICLKKHKLSGDFWSLKTEDCKSKFFIQNGCKNTHKQKSKQTVRLKIAQQNLKWSWKTHKTHTIATWKVTIPL